MPKSPKHLSSESLEKVASRASKRLTKERRDLSNIIIVFDNLNYHAVTYGNVVNCANIARAFAQKAVDDANAGKQELEKANKEATTTKETLN